MLTFNVHSEIKNFLSNDFKELMILCPFISLSGLKKVLGKLNLNDKIINVVTRWRKIDVISGVSDIEVYPFLKEKKISLYHNDYIHLKTLIRDKKECLLGSANITDAGLGLSKSPNIELITTESICSKDYACFQKILDDSFEIDDNFYKEMEILKAKNKSKFEFINQMKHKYLDDLEWYKFLSPTWNRKEFMKKWNKT